MHLIPMVCQSLQGAEELSITSLKKYSAPKELMTTEHLKSSRNGVVVDLRCSGCTTAFVSKQAMLSHCQQTGHTPHMDLDEALQPVSTELFIGFCNVALQRALGERMAKWGKDYIDPKNWTEPKDRTGRSLGVRIFRAFSCEFGIHSFNGKNSLTLTVDLRAKIIRTKSLLDVLCNGMDPQRLRFDQKDIIHFKKQYQGEVVICMYDKKCYPIVDLDFDNSPDTLMIKGTDMNHTQYFKLRKDIDLRYPHVAPIVAVLGKVTV